MFKIALNAGHGLYTAGKRCLKSIDPNETREWVLNSRICNKIEEKLKAYSGYELIRLDDTTGKSDVSLKTRTDKANKFGANFYLAIHHNAGIAGGNGGGIIAITYTKVDSITADWQKARYDSLIKHTGLKGNRSAPLQKQDLHEVRESNMPAVLIECGFMDSVTDTPIILTEDFAEKAATALVEVLVSKGGLVKKEETAETKPVITVPVQTAKPTNEKISVTYQVWDDVNNKWLPNVKDLEDYAGIFGHDVCAIYASLSKGNITYKVHYKGGSWLPEVTNRTDYAGIFNKPIDGLMIKTDTGKTVHYAVHLRRSNKWLPFVTGYSEADGNNGYAGILGQEIDAIKIYID